MYNNKHFTVLIESSGDVRFVFEKYNNRYMIFNSKFVVSYVQKKNKIMDLKAYIY